MFINKTLEYKKLLRKRDINFIPLVTTGIRSSLGNIRENILRLSVRQEKHCLPSFTSKRKRQGEIEKIKKSISDEILVAEKKIEDILGYLGPRAFVNTMHAYFVKQLKTTIYSYRSLQQEFLKKIDFYEDLEQQEDENENGNNAMVLENVKDVRKSIYDLTTVLLDMKMAVGQQSLQIDRLDFYFDSINFHLEGANAELEKMPTSYRGFKNKMMYFLLCLSITLVLISTLKMAKNRR